MLPTFILSQDRIPGEIHSYITCSFFIRRQSRFGIVFHFKDNLYPCTSYLPDRSPPFYFILTNWVKLNLDGAYKLHYEANPCSGLEEEASPCSGLEEEDNPCKSLEDEGNPFYFILTDRVKLNSNGAYKLR